MSLSPPRNSGTVSSKTQAKRSGKKIKSKEVISEDEDETNEDNRAGQADTEDSPYPNMIRTDEPGPPEFDWKTIAEDDDLELWLVRVPHGVKPKHLDGVKLQLSNSGAVGRFAKNNETYEVSDVGTAVGADEMKGLKLLLRRESEEGKRDYAMAPRGIARHLLITQSFKLPTPTPSMSPDSSQLAKRRIKPKPVQPTPLLTHRFFPVGTFDQSRRGRKSSRAEDLEMVSSPPPPSIDVIVSEEPPRKKKKRKSLGQDMSAVAGDVEAPEMTPKKKRKKRDIEKGNESVETLETSMRT